MINSKSGTFLIVGLLVAAFGCASVRGASHLQRPSTGQQQTVDAVLAPSIAEDTGASARPPHHLAAEASLPSVADPSALMYSGSSDLDCLVCLAVWDEIGDPQDPASWAHLFSLGSEELCDTEPEAQQNNCRSCNGVSTCHDTAQVGFCHVTCYPSEEAPIDAIALAVENEDASLLVDYLLAGTHVNWNEQRQLIQPLKTCGAVARNIPVSKKLAGALTERLLFHRAVDLLLLL